MDILKDGLKLSNEVQEWLVLYKKNSVKPTTYDRLIISLDLMKKHAISDMNFEEIKAEHIQKYVNYLVNAGYARSTIKKQYCLLHAFFRSKKMEDIFDQVSIPAQSMVKKAKKEVVAYTMEEQRRLIPVLMKVRNPSTCAAMLMLESGMRIGEVLALSWDDILWDRKAVRIHKTLIRITNAKKIEIQQGAKSHCSNRTIPLSTRAMELLRGMYCGKSGLIFSKENGEPLTYEAMRWHIKKACDEAGVPYYGQHVFRHTFATNCYYRGCNVKILSKLLGHADVTVTYNIYIHLFGDALEEMRSVIG